MSIIAAVVAVIIGLGGGYLFRKNVAEGKLNTAEAKAAAWQREHADALASSNAWVDAQGLPLDQYRQF